MAAGWLDFLRRALSWLESSAALPSSTPTPGRIFNVPAGDRIYNVSADDRIYEVLP